MLTEVEVREFPERQAEPEPQEREWGEQVPGPGRVLPFWGPREREQEQEQVQEPEPREQVLELAWVPQEPGRERVLPSSELELLVREPELASVPQEPEQVLVPEQQEQARVPELPFLALQELGQVREQARALAPQPWQLLAQERTSAQALELAQVPQPWELLEQKSALALAQEQALALASELAQVHQPWEFLEQESALEQRRASLLTFSQLPGREQERRQVPQRLSTPLENRAPPAWWWRACAPSQGPRLWQAQESHHASDRTFQ